MCPTDPAPLPLAWSCVCGQSGTTTKHVLRCPDCDRVLFANIEGVGP